MSDEAFIATIQTKNTRQKSERRDRMTYATSSLKNKELIPKNAIESEMIKMTRSEADFFIQELKKDDKTEKLCQTEEQKELVIDHIEAYYSDLLVRDPTESK